MRERADGEQCLPLRKRGRPHWRLPGSAGGIGTEQARVGSVPGQKEFPSWIRKRDVSMNISTMSGSEERPRRRYVWEESYSRDSGHKQSVGFPNRQGSGHGHPR